VFLLCVVCVRALLADVADGVDVAAGLLPLRLRQHATLVSLLLLLLRLRNVWICSCSCLCRMKLGQKHFVLDVADVADVAGVADDSTLLLFFL